MAKKSRNQNSSDKSKGELSLDQLDSVAGGAGALKIDAGNAQMMTDLQLTQPNALQPHAQTTPGVQSEINTGTTVGTTAGNTSTGWEATAVAQTGVVDHRDLNADVRWTGQAGADVDASFYAGVGIKGQAGGHAIASSSLELGGGVSANSLARADGDVYLKIGAGVGAGIEGGVRASQNLVQTNDHDVGGGVTMHNTTVAEAGVKAEAGAHAKLSPLDGNLTVGANAFAGGYLSVGETVSADGGGFGGSLGVQAISPGSVGVGFTPLIGVQDGKFNVGLHVAGAVGLGGGVLDANFSVDTAHLVNAGNTIHDKAVDPAIEGAVGLGKTIGAAAPDLAHAGLAGAIGVGNTIAHGATGVVNSIGDGATNAANTAIHGMTTGLSNAVGGVVGGITNSINSAADHAISSATHSIANAIGNVAQGGIGALAPNVSGVVNDLQHAASEAVHQTVSAATSAAADAVKAQTDAAAQAMAEARASAERAAAEAAAQAKAAAEHAAAEAKAIAERAAAEAAAQAKAAVEQARAMAEKAAAELKSAQEAAAREAARVAAEAKAAAERAAAEIRAAQEAAAREAARVAAEIKAAAEREAARVAEAARREAERVAAEAARVAEAAKREAERVAAEAARAAEATRRELERVANEAKRALEETFCHVAGTPIAMADGTYKPVEQLKMGDEVLLGGQVLGRGEVMASDLYSYRGTVLNGRHAVFEDGRWVRVADSALATALDMPATPVYPVVTANHLLVCEQYICADLAEMDKDIGAVGRLEVMNADTDRNVALSKAEKLYGLSQRRAA